MDGVGKALVDMFQGVTNASGVREISANFSLTLDKI